MEREATDREADRQLMFRVGAGDVEAFRALYEGYLGRVVSFLRRQGGVNVEDLAQEVFVRLWQYRGRFAGRSCVKTYLMGIAQNVLRESWRRTGRWPKSLDAGAMEEMAAAEAEERVDDELRRRMEVAKAHLSRNQLQAVELVYRCRMKPVEAADLVGCSYKAMRRRLEEAMRRLRGLLGQRLRS